MEVELLMTRILDLSNVFFKDSLTQELLMLALLSQIVVFTRPLKEELKKNTYSILINFLWYQVQRLLDFTRMQKLQLTNPIRDRF
jgi:hypothetical protein